MLDMVVDVKKAQEGDLDTFVKLIRQLESRLYGLAKSIVKRDEDCADAIQETLLKAYKSLNTLKKHEFFNTWIIRILINECNQVLRLRKRTIVMGELPETNYPIAAHGADHQTSDLQEAVDRLNDTLRLVVHLFYYQDLSVKQIAEILEISEGAVRARLHRARGVLADWMNSMRMNFAGI